MRVSGNPPPAETRRPRAVKSKGGEPPSFAKTLEGMLDAPARNYKRAHKQATTHEQVITHEQAIPGEQAIAQEHATAGEEAIPHEKAIAHKHGTAHKKAADKRGNNRLSQSANDVSHGAPVLSLPINVAPPLVQDTKAASTLNEPEVIRNLVREILVVTEPRGRQTVDVQFNSTTLDGLRVRISREDDKIAIRFLTASASVSDLLSRNAAQLSEALQAKGLHVVPIQVELRAAPVSMEAGPPARDGERGGGGQGNGRQQKHPK
jgi:flagellar hook-length control protein FliK